MNQTVENLNVGIYDQNSSYEQYDVVAITGASVYPKYFVNITGSTSNLLNTGVSNEYWKSFDEDWLFEDVWTPTYKTSFNLQNNGHQYNFGDGYCQNVENSLFFNRINYQMEFDGINNTELKSLLCFFEYKGGTEPFRTNINSFITGRKFIAKNWKHTYESNNINGLSVSLIEWQGSGQF